MGLRGLQILPFHQKTYPQMSQIFPDYKETLSKESALSHLRNLCNLWTVTFIFSPSSLDG
jgi:hypothetical protein